MKYVIIGNSAAAAGCIEGIRSVDKKGSITVISKEKHHIYSRPLISYLLCGKTDEEKMKYRPDSFYKDNGCELILGAEVTKIDPKAKTVTLGNGDVISYDKLFAGTGSNPFVPPMKGLENVKNKFTFMSLDDALDLDKALTPKSRVLIVGAGLIGLKCAEGIYGKCAHITVVDLADRILTSILTDDAAKIMQKHIEKKGIEFKLGTSVAEFDGENALLTNGETEKFDIVVTAVGVRPNTALIAEAGGKVNRGIVTDEYCRTTLPDIYAGGDCAESYDITTDTNRVLALLPLAYMQGQAAGKNMAGEITVYDNAIPMNAIGLFDLHIISAGSYDGEKYIESDGTNYKMLVTRDGLLKGYILMGDVLRAGIYTSLIREKTPLSEVDFELIKKHPALMAFSKEKRKEKLAQRR